jgi:hypothetical protein
MSTDKEQKWPCVIVETPYSGDIAANTQYALEAMQDCLKRGEAPFLSHLLYTQVPKVGFVSDDDKKHELVGRDAAMRAGWAWGAKADKTVVYTDRDISKGMKAGIAAAEKANRPIEYRTLKGPNDIDLDEMSPELLATLKERMKQADLLSHGLYDPENDPGPSALPNLGKRKRENAKRPVEFRSLVKKSD